MKLLILGGTRFLGPHLVSVALERNHEITLFNRGKHPRRNLPNTETIYGDRQTDLYKLQGRRWDAVIDMCGYLPDSVRASAEAFSNSIDTYVFISSISAYADVSVVGIDESAPLASLTNEQLEQAKAIDASGDVSAVIYGKMYGGLKVLCEQAAHEAIPHRVLIIRPGLIVGPYDHTDRFTYWVARVASGGEVLAPGRPGRPVQFIDVRDLAEWIVKMVERNETGIYNATGLPNSTTMEEVLEESRLVTGTDATFTWVSENFLNQEKVAAWGEMPLWLPEEDAPNLKGAMFISCNKAVRAALTFRPLRDTIKDTVAWWKRDCRNDEMKAGITRERERALLQKWHETQLQ